MRREKMKKKKSIWKRIVLGVLLVIKMKFKQGKRKTFNRIRQVAKWIANIRFDCGRSEQATDPFALQTIRC